MNNSKNNIISNALAEDDSLPTQLSITNKIDLFLKLFELQDVDLKQKTDFSPIITNKLKAVYETFFFQFINNDKRRYENQKNKLRTYRLFKTKYAKEMYTNSINKKHLSSIYAKFRLSNHTLMIEKGRHLGLKVSERLCPFRCEEIEDEFHFFSVCKTYTSFRNSYISKIPNSYIPNQTLDIHSFTNLLACQNEAIVLSTIIFIHESFKLREAALSKP